MSCTLYETLAHAADLLEREAEGIRVCHTTRGRWDKLAERERTEWIDMVATIKDLRRFLAGHDYAKVRAWRAKRNRRGPSDAP